MDPSQRFCFLLEITTTNLGPGLRTSDQTSEPQSRPRALDLLASQGVHHGADRGPGGRRRGGLQTKEPKELF